VKPADDNPHAATSGILRYGPIVLIVLIAMAFWISESILATIIIISDGALAAIIWIAAVGLGWWLLGLLRLPEAPLRWQLVLSAGLGMGALVLLVLLLGLMGILHRSVWVGILAASALGCVVRAGVYVHRAQRGSEPRQAIEWRAAHLLWLPAMGFLLITLLVAVLPPGLNWGDEAGGYDVLEYHFGGPKEYWLAGRIIPLPHNVYTYFPFNAEMLYLLAFVIKGGPYDGVYLAQLLNASLAIWAVVAAWLAGRELGPTQGAIAGALMATCPWLTYLSGVAYAENGLLFASMLTLAVLVRMWERPACRQGAWLLLAGLLAGVACGFKYTAVVMIGLPVGLVTAWVGWTARPRQPLGGLLFVVGAAIMFCPWLARNNRWADNPVFPLAHQALGYRPDLWDDTLTARWDRAHTAGADEADLSSRLGRLWQRVLAEPNYGPAIFLAAALGVPAAFGARRGLAIGCLIILTVQTVTWLMATHLFARFGVPLIVPLVVLAAVGWSSVRHARMATLHRAVMIVVVTGGAAVNLVHVGRLYYDHTRDADGRRRGWFGLTGALAESDPINRSTPTRGATVWMVGEARAFYVTRPCVYHVVFSRDPLATFARTRPTGLELLDWFRQRGVTHVYVGWSEIDRFRRPGNYGWDDAIDETLFASMRSAGAILAHAERNARTGRPIYEILKVPVQ